MAQTGLIIPALLSSSPATVKITVEAFVEAQTSFVKSCSPPSISSPGRRYSRYSNRGSCQAAAASGGLRRLSLHRERLLRCAGPEVAAVLLLLRAGMQDGGCGWMGVSTACFPLAHGRTLQNAAATAPSPGGPGYGTDGSWQGSPPFPAGGEGSQAVEELRLLLLHLVCTQNMAFGAVLLGKDPPVL